jgi:hypothetical protein
VSLQCRSAASVFDLSGVAAAARRVVGGDDDLGVAAVDPLRQRVGREAREDDGMDRADPGAGEHGIGRLGDHRQVEDDAVALADAQFLEDVGHLADFAVQLAVGDVLGRVLRIVRLPDDRRLVAARGEVAVDAVGATLSVPSSNHLIEMLPGAKDVFFTFGVGLDPVDPLALPRPRRPPGRRSRRRTSRW